MPCSLISTVQLIAQKAVFILPFCSTRKRQLTVSSVPKDIIMIELQIRDLLYASGRSYIHKILEYIPA